MNDKFFIKNIKRRNKSKDFLLPFNIINLSNDPSLKDLTIKPIVKLKNNYNSFTKKINQGTNTVYSVLKKVKNKNKHNRFMVKRKRLLPNYDDNKYGEDLNASTIHSNGKFQNSKCNNQDNFSNKFNKKFVIRQNIKRFILNGKKYNNIDPINKDKIIKGLLINNEENNKKNLKDNLKSLNISSHYLGNTFNNKFGITTNKFCIDKNSILTYAKENNKYKNDYNTSSMLLNKNNESKLKFITLNMPNNSNFFNGMSSSNACTRVKCVINNEKLYQKLINQMTIVFKNRIKKYSSLKSYEKNHKPIFNDEIIFSNNILNMKQQRIFNDRYIGHNLDIEQIKKNNNIKLFQKNTLLNKDDYKTFDIHTKYMKINIRNANKENKFINNTLSNDEMDMRIHKK